MSGVLTRDRKIAVLDAMVAVGGILNGAKLKLFSNNFTPDHLTLLTDITQADFTGYAEVTLSAWGEAFRDGGSQPKIVHVSVQYTPTGSTVSNTIFGWYLTNAAGTVLLMAKRLDTPVVLTDNSTALIVQPEYRYGS
jgi:hypothetical protein